MKVLLARAQLTPLTKRTKTRNQRKISIQTKLLYLIENDLGKIKSAQSTCTVTHSSVSTIKVTQRQSQHTHLGIKGQACKSAPVIRHLSCKFEVLTGAS